MEIMLLLNDKRMTCLNMVKEWRVRTATSVVLCFRAFICLRSETL